MEVEGFGLDLHGLHLTFLARKGGCLCSQAKRSTGMSSKSASFSWRHVITRVVHVDIGAPYSFSAIDTETKKKKKRMMKKKKNIWTESKKQK